MTAPTVTFPISMERPARFAGPLPEACDVVLIGGGIMGVMTAWYLAEAGRRVVLCEKGRIAGEQSSRNWGWIRQQGRDPSELSIMVESLRIWKTLATEFGSGLGFRQEGVMYLARSEREMTEYEAWLSHARDYGLDSAMVTAKGVRGAISGAVAPWIGGIFTASDARAEPWVAVPMLAEGAAARGAVIVEDCAVRRLDRAAGQIAGVVTERGRIACAQVVLAGGAWSSLLLRSEGISLPQLSVLASVAATVSLPEVFAGNAADDRFAFRRRQDGGYSIAAGDTHDFFIGPDAFRNFVRYLPVLKKDFGATTFHPRAPSGYPDAWGTRRKWSGDQVSPFEAMRILNPAPNMAMLNQVASDFGAAFPGLGRPAFKTAWAGMIDTMPDVIPVIDHVAGLPGLTVATGLSGHGFGIGPGMGRVVADLVLGRELGHDLRPFRLTRFSDGSGVGPGGAL